MSIQSINNKLKFPRRIWIAIFASTVILFAACYESTDHAKKTAEMLQPSQSKDPLNNPFSNRPERPYSLLNPLLNWLLDEKP